MTVDPVCGMSVRERGNRQSVEYADLTYYFCSSECLQRFDREPDLFTAGAGVGLLANDDRSADEQHVPGPGPNARLEQAPVDAGPG
jgi:YHS domain-containing protein